jgi:hypothetical protein
VAKADAANFYPEKVAVAGLKGSKLKIKGFFRLFRLWPLLVRFFRLVLMEPFERMEQGLIFHLVLSRPGKWPFDFAQ